MSDEEKIPIREVWRFWHDRTSWAETWHPAFHNAWRFSGKHAILQLFHALGVVAVGFITLVVVRAKEPDAGLLYDLLVTALAMLLVVVVLWVWHAAVRLILLPVKQDRTIASLRAELERRPPEKTETPATQEEEREIDCMHKAMQLFRPAFAYAREYYPFLYDSARNSPECAEYRLHLARLLRAKWIDLVQARPDEALPEIARSRPFTHQYRTELFVKLRRALTVYVYLAVEIRNLGGLLLDPESAEYKELVRRHGTLLNDLRTMYAENDIIRRVADGNSESLVNLFPIPS